MGLFSKDKSAAQPTTKQAQPTTGATNASAAVGASTRGQVLNDPDLVKRVKDHYKEFSTAYVKELERLDKCEQYYLCKHWEEVATTDPNEPRPVTPSLFSAIESAKAEMMMRFPVATVLPEDPQDRDVADVVSAIIRKNHDAANYKKEFAKIVHDLYVSGYCVQEVGYDVRANRGIGGAFIRWVDNHNIMFDPQATEDINDGRAVMKISPRSIEWLDKNYPQYEGKFAASVQGVRLDEYLPLDQAKSALFIEYWWREFDETMYGGIGGFRVHMAQVVGDNLLADSRIAKPEGYFADGEYPFKVTYLFQRKGTPFGFGMVDIHGTEQMMADKLDQQVVINAYMAKHNKLLVTEASGFDVEDLRDWSKDVHKGESLNGITWFTTPPLPEYLLEKIRNMRDNMKDTSGANDVSQGNMGAGITSKGAIMALQDASNKRVRTVCNRVFEDYKACVVKEIEIEREYNELPRDVVVSRDGEQTGATFEKSMMTRPGKSGTEIPIEFAVSVKVEVENPWTKDVYNTLILELVDRQMIPAQIALELMIFDGKEEVLSKLKEAQTEKAPVELAQEQAAGQAAQQATDQAAQQQQQLAAQMQQMQTPDAAMA